jgi:hypothetical protein
VPYSIFSTDSPEPDALGDLSVKDVRERLTVLEDYSSLELEIAATVVFLRQIGFGDKAIEMTKQLKPLKATDKRIERAFGLIADLGL